MSKQHTLSWILVFGVLLILWAARRAIVKCREISARTQQHEHEFLTQFPEFAGARDVEQRRRRSQVGVFDAARAARASGGQRPR
jgi:hypothetical protein